MENEGSAIVELERVIASLNQLLSYDYVDLGSGASGIEEEFEVVLGLREPAFRHRSMSVGSYEADYSSLGAIEAAERRRNEKKDWSIALTDEFVRDTKQIDRKLQGRILEALLELAKTPMDARGNSCKPLVGNLSGLWRLRIGDTRLIYRPDPSCLVVYCLAFTARADAYR